MSNTPRNFDGELSLSIVDNIEAERVNYLARVKRLTAKSAGPALKLLTVELMAMYQIDGLDAIRALATMEISDNFQQNQVKLTAAKLLAFPNGQQESGGGDDTLAGTLKQLNDDYHKSAPRIRTIRERVVEYEGAAPPAIDVSPS